MGPKTDPLLAVNGPILLSPSQQATCQRIRSSQRANEAARLRDRMAFHLGRFLLDTEEEVNMELAKLLARCLAEALKTYPTLDNNKREWLRVGVEYFVLDEDADPDADPISGLADDATVISAVLEHCGFHDLAKHISDYLA